MRDVARREFLAALAGVFVLKGGGPSVILLMRHGEDAGQRDFNLNPRGYQRAAALPKLFGSRLPKPQVIIATRASKGSNRPIETVEPLAKALNLPIDNRFRDDDFAALAHDLLTDERYEGKTILVCWHHGSIPKLAKALGVKGAPKWPDRQFDHVWVIEPKRKSTRFEDVPQKLLDGDR